MIYEDKLLIEENEIVQFSLLFDLKTGEHMLDSYPMLIKTAYRVVFFVDNNKLEDEVIARKRDHHPN